MKISIRQFLLVYLLLAITLTTSITAIGNYYLDQKDIQRHLDSLLMEVGLSIQAMLDLDIRRHHLHSLQENINRIPLETEKVLKRTHHHFSPSVKKGQFQFQVWTDDGKLLLHSVNSPLLPLSNGGYGLSDKLLGGSLWRVFTTYTPNLGLSIVVAERYETRNELANRITRDDIYIMFITYPLSALLIWFVIGRGFQTLERIAREVASRAPNYLDPVDLSEVPPEIKPMIKELNKLLLRLKQGLDRESRFSADAAHELRTPLAALKTQAQLALQTSSNEERTNTLKNVLKGVDRCTHVVQQLLTLSRLMPTADGTIQDAKTVNLNKLATELIAQLVPFALKKHIEIELQCEDESIEILGNETALTILLRNLIDNSIRYIKEYDHIWVVIKQSDDHVILRVADDGPGIPAEFRARVFERFFRMLGNKSPGSGLGLAIVQHIAEMHHAEVTLGSSEGGKGLQVEIHFPPTRQAGNRTP